MQALHVFRDPPLDGPTNMARDEHLLQVPAPAPVSLRIYGWQPPTISLGYFQRFETLSTLPPDVRSLPVVRRLTGGGAILHDQEVTYCLAADARFPPAGGAPATLYRLVHTCWREALSADGVAVELAPDEFPLPTPRTGPFFCFAQPGRTDLLVAGRKVLGSAQRRTSGRVLQHGSLILAQRFASHPGAHLGAPTPAQLAHWVDGFVSRVADALGLVEQPASWSAAQLADVARRRSRYTADAWTRLR